MDWEYSRKAEDYEFFSRPQNLQDLRYNLAMLLNQERTSLQDLLTFLQNHLQDNSHLEGGESGCGCKLEELVGFVGEHVRERWNWGQSVGHLAIRMIDFITEETARHAFQEEHLRRELDLLHNAVEEANARNTLIENDVSVFRQQLEAAREQLLEITEEREQQTAQEQQDWEARRDLQIENLQKELQRMKSQLTYFRESALSRSSLHSPQLPNKNTPQTASLGLLSVAKPIKLWDDRAEEKDVIQKYSSYNRELQEENQRLKLEIDNLKKSTARLMILEGENKNQIQPIPHDALPSTPSKSLLRVKTSKVICQHPSSPSNSSPFDFQEFLRLFRKRDEKTEQPQEFSEKEQQQECCEKQQLQKKASQLELHSEASHHQQLNSQWSRSSLLGHNPQPLHSQLIFLTQESQEPQQEQSQYDCFFGANTAIENKDTEASLKESSRNVLTFSSAKSFESIGINTQRDEKTKQDEREERQGKETKRAAVMSRGSVQLGKSGIMTTIVHSSIISSLTNFVVSSRVKRRSKGANSGTAKILL